MTILNYSRTLARTLCNDPTSANRKMKHEPLFAHANDGLGSQGKDFKEQRDGILIHTIGRR